jgi:hypothetical protein
MSVSRGCRALSSRDLCRPEESCQMWCVTECDPIQSEPSTPVLRQIEEVRLKKIERECGLNSHVSARFLLLRTQE